MPRPFRRPEPVPVVAPRSGGLEAQFRALDERLSNVEEVLRHMELRLRAVEDHLYGRNRDAAPATRSDGMLLRLALVEGKVAPGQPPPPRSPPIVKP